MRSVSHIEPNLRFEVVHGVIFYDWHADFQRKGDVICQVALPSSPDSLSSSGDFEIGSSHSVYYSVLLQILGLHVCRRRGAPPFGLARDVGTHRQIDLPTVLPTGAS